MTYIHGLYYTREHLMKQLNSDWENSKLTITETKVISKWLSQFN